MCLRKENRLLMQKVWDSVRMSDRLGGRRREDRWGKVEVRAVSKRGHDNRMCGIERGTLHKEHRGGSDCDIR